MNCLYITLFFNIVAGIVQTFIKSWSQLPYPRVIEVCRQSFEPRRDFFLHLIIVFEIFPTRCSFRWRNKWKSLGARYGMYGGWSNISNVQLLRWEIVWRNAPRIWWDFGSALPFQTRLTQTKPVLTLSNEHGSQVKDQGRRQCCHNKHKNFSIGLHVMYLYFPDRHTIKCIRQMRLFSILKVVLHSSQKSSNSWLSPHVTTLSTFCLHYLYRTKNYRRSANSRPFKFRVWESVESRSYKQTLYTKFIHLHCLHYTLLISEASLCFLNQ